MWEIRLLTRSLVSSPSLIIAAIYFMYVNKVRGSARFVGDKGIRYGSQKRSGTTVQRTLFWSGVFSFHFYYLSGAKCRCRLCGRLSGLPGARSAQFFNDFDFLAPQNTKFCSPAGTSLWGLATIGSWLSKYWNIYWIWISSLSIEKIDAIFF